MSQKNFYIYFFIVLCLATTFYGIRSYAQSIDQVRFGTHPDKVRMVLDVGNIDDFRIFTLSDPYRMVIDLPTFTWNAGHIEKQPQNAITDIRQGTLTPDISRIVLDLESPVSVESAFLLPAQNNKTSRIVVDYKRVTSTEFHKTKSNIYGTLEVNEPNIQTGSNNMVPRPPENTQRPQRLSAKKPLVIIDPGHGGQDPGAQSTDKRIYEKHVVLALAKELKKQLLESGKYRVMLTRETDVYIRLKDRVKFARKHDGDLFVSIHADSIHKSSVRGTSVYTISKKASDAQTAKLAEKENQSDLMAGLDLNVEDEQVAFILGDFLMNDTMNQSKFFANTLVDTLKSYGIKTLQNPHRYAGFAVLKSPDVPSILIEAGFMSNKKEARLLNQSAHRKKLAKAIQKGINAYFDHVQKNEQN
ncbi:MAG: N-acetylmuramoyl-L-alanine amidase [Alphaproteobacteria bacterium]